MEELKIGSTAPSFALPADDGSIVSSESLYGQRYILYFYPKNQTPGCTLEARDFRQYAEEFLQSGYLVFGVSRDSVESHCRFRVKEGLNFRLLSDKDGTLCQAYDVMRRILKLLPAIQRSTFVIDEEGKITHIYRDVIAKGHVQQLRKDLHIGG